MKHVGSFGESMYTQKASIVEAEEDQSNLLKNMVEFDNKSRPKNKEVKDEKDTYESAYALYKGRELTHDVFKNGIFPIKATQGKGLKILSHKQMLQRLPIALAEVKAGNTSKNLLNEIRQIMYSLYQAKEITEKVYNNIMIS